MAEAGDAVWYVRPASGGQFGPASGEVMRTWLDEGRVGVDSLVWREGWRDWQEAAEVFAQLGAGRQAGPLDEIAPGGTSVARAAAARSSRASARRRSRNIQTLMIILLIFAVIALGTVFGWVVFGDRGGGTDGPDPASGASLSRARQSVTPAQTAAYPPFGKVCR
ncbi:MAG: DUF4339 domain-containing protein [Pirellulales bacterium]|nr:DUF4339 domain-containing protein [Pirellulales bacterium]